MTGSHEVIGSNPLSSMSKASSRMDAFFFALFTAVPPKTSEPVRRIDFFGPSSMICPIQKGNLLTSWEDVDEPQMAFIPFGTHNHRCACAPPFAVRPLTNTDSETSMWHQVEYPLPIRTRTT